MNKIGKKQKKKKNKKKKNKFSKSSKLNISLGIVPFKKL